MNRFIHASLFLVGSILRTVSADGTNAPIDLYTEVRAMAYAGNNLAYSWAYLKQIARVAHSNGKEFKGFDFEDDGTIVQSPRSLGDILQIFDDNKDLIDHNEKFGEKLDSNNFDAFLEGMMAFNRTNAEHADSLVLQRYDDMNQADELVYAIATDEINNRIIVIFRGTENSLARNSNWASNLNIIKIKEDVPGFMKGKLKEDTVGLHQGFHKYLFQKSENSGLHTYDEITRQVKNLLLIKPYNVYVTGHSLGAALSTLYSYYLAADPEIPSPVKCINFASPRIGDRNFLNAMSYLEKTNKLQLLRVVNDKDVVPTMPAAGFAHVGFQIKLFNNEGAKKKKDPVLFYPNANLGLGAWFQHSLNNRVPVLYAPKVGTEHAGTEYTRRLDDAMEWFATYNLDQLYQNEAITGYEL